MDKISKYCRRYLVVSVPHRGINLSLSLRLPFSKNFHLIVKIPFPFYFEKDDHLWEIGTGSLNVSKIKSLFESRGFTVKNDFLVPENPYHRFFILEKKSP